MLAYLHQRTAHWNKVYARPSKPAYYHRALQSAYKFHIPEGLRVLELGCGDGGLLAAVKPSFGVGIDISRAALKRAKQSHPELVLIQADAHFLPFDGTFDVIILSDLINDLWDVQLVFKNLAKYSHSRTRILVNFHSRLWQGPLALAEKLGLKKPTLLQNWFTLEDVKNLSALTDHELVKHENEIVFPLGIPLLAALFNKILIRFWPFWIFAVTDLVVLRPMKATTDKRSKEPSLSIIVPARNEAGNIKAIFERLPELGPKTELIFVEGHSRDDTYQTIEREIAAHPNQPASLLKQSGIGKAAAVWDGFAAAKNDVLLILDSDLSVAPEDLERFYEAVRTNKGEFINGSRLVYPMEQKAMQFANLIGNKSFGLIFSWLLSQPVKDTLCGTKVIWREDYELLRQRWPKTFDPFGDFDLLLGASKLDLKIVDLPVRYRERTYGQTNISRWRHGVMLLRITIAAAIRLKFRLGQSA